MAVVAVHDYDYFTYNNVVPNLECAKLIAYHRNHRNIAVLTPTLIPEKYTTCYIRKDYDDGIYPKKFFEENCIYGGRAFTQNEYNPLPREVELTVPNMHIYDDYISYFGARPAEQTQIKRILNCAHIRLAPDGKNPLTFEELKPNFIQKVNGIFLHDYNLGDLDIYDLVVKLQNQREYKTRFGINPYPVGNKFPIKVYDEHEVERWLKIVAIPDALFFEYCGLMSNEILNKLATENRRLARQVYYNIAHGCSSEKDFLCNRLPKIYPQMLFLRRNNLKTLLTYDDGFFKTHELEKLIELFNCYLSFKWKDFVPYGHTLYRFCRDNAKYHYKRYSFLNMSVSVEDSRKAFQFIRENNYEVFKMFYELDRISYEGGKLIDEYGNYPSFD